MRKFVNYVSEEIYHTGPLSVDERNDFFYVDMCGITMPDSNYEMFRYNNHVYVFEYVVSGDGYIDSEGHRYSLHAGDFYFLKRGFTGHYYCEKSNPYKKIWVNAQGQLIDRLVDIYSIQNKVTIIPNASKRIEQDLHAVLKMLSNESLTDIQEIHRCCSIKLIDILSIISNAAQGGSKVAVYSNAENIRRYIDLNIYNDITLASIAKYMYMHESTVIRTFQKKYGKTPMKYLNELRITAAKRMLHDSVDIKNIAEILRFSDISYFSLCFKKETGVSPRQYIKDKIHTGESITTAEKQR